MSGLEFLSLWAVHIADGVLAWPWLAGGFVVAGCLALAAVAVDFVLARLDLRPFREEEIAQIALVTAAFFVASLIHVRLGPTSVHLLLNGLVGVVLGWRAALAIPVGLFLQAALIGHGGFLVLGVNSCVMVIPALLAWLLFAGLSRLPGLRPPRVHTSLVAVLGVLIGAAAVLATAALNFLVLLWGGEEDWHTLALATFVAHLPVAVLEGVVMGFTVGFLARVKPEMLGWATLCATRESSMS